MKSHNLRWRLLFVCLLFSLAITGVCAAQSVSSDAGSANGPVAASDPGSQPRRGNSTELVSTIRIGPGDELDVNVFGLPELSQHVRVGSSGDVSLPLVGTTHLAGLSSEEAQALIEKLLADGHFVNSPHVSVYVKEYTTEGISLMGEVNRPGVYPVLGAHRLLDLIQTAGGPTQTVGSTVTISHRDDPDHPVTLSLYNETAKMAQNNVELRPGDTVVISKAGIVYVLGEVNRPGGFVMGGNKITASQVLAMAAGPTHLASLGHTLVIRTTPDGLKNVPLSLQKILKAQIPDVTLNADDIIFVPSNKLKSAIGPLNLSSVLLGAAIYRVP
jgi:polysaccharide biosynthesis/export protein